MKKMILVALTLLSVSAQAFDLGDLIGGLRDGRGRDGRDYRDGRDDRGRRDSTYRWADMGTYKLPKAVAQEIVIDVRGDYVNEITLRATGRVEITSAYAQLSDGRTINLNNLTGTVREGRDVRGSLDYRQAVRVERLYITGTSPDLIGSRGTLQVLLGLAR